VLISIIFILLFHKIIIEDNYKNYYQNMVISIYKTCYNKKPIFHIKREWKIWIMDNTKQGLSSLLGHIWATYISIFISDDSTFECNWFLIQFLVDTLFAMYLCFIFSKLTIFIIGLCNKDIQNKYLTIGYYDNNTKIWIIQTFHWIFVSMSARIICSFFIILTKNIYNEPNIWFNNIWINKRQEQLIFTILLMPLILNAIQYLTQNWFLRWISDKKTLLHEHLIIHEIV
jgi:hypothetical protein